MEGRHAAHRALRQETFDRRQTKDIVLAKTHAERIEIVKRLPRPMFVTAMAQINRDELVLGFRLDVGGLVPCGKLRFPIDSDELLAPRDLDEAGAFLIFFDFEATLAEQGDWRGDAILAVEQVDNVSGIASDVLFLLALE